MYVTETGTGRASVPEQIFVQKYGAVLLVMMSLSLDIR